MSADSSPVDPGVATVRRAERCDFSAVCALYRLLQTTHAQGHPEIFAPAGESELTEDDFCASIEARDMLVLVAERDGLIVAAAQASIVDLPGNRALRARRVAYVTHLVTLPALRRQGHGRALMQAIAGWARTHDVETIELYVWEGSTEATAFYRALGYRAVANLLAFRP